MIRVIGVRVMFAVPGMRGKGCEGGVCELEEEAGVSGCVGGSEGVRGVGGIGLRIGEGDEEGAEEGLEGWEDEVEATAKAFAVEGEDGTEDSAESDILESVLFRSVVCELWRRRCGGRDGGHDLVDVPLGDCSGLVGISTAGCCGIGRMGSDTYI